MAVRVLIADDFRMARAVFEHAVEMSDAYELEAAVSSAEEAAEYCRDHAPDLVIMDIVMREGANGLECAGRIKSEHPETKVIIVTSMPEVSYLKRAREMGADSFWYKEVEERTILEVMDRTMAGESVYPDTTPTVKIGNALSTEFTDREIEVLRELVGGASNKEIAATLFITERTVKMHINNMLMKTGYRSRLELAIKAREEGIVIHD